VGDVRLRELGLHDRGRHGRLQRLFRVVAAGQNWGTFAWTLALSISYAFVIFTAPIVGDYADTHAGNKILLAITTSG
jgi:hypothetical protein